MRFAGLALLAGSLWAQVDYQREVHPILAAKCASCHSAEKRSGGLSLGTLNDVLDGGRSGAAIKPGNSATSLLVRRSNGEVSPRMPLAGPALTDRELATLRTWIDEGARATPISAAAKPKWEAPLELKRPAIPEVTWKLWDEPVDRFVAAYLAHRGSKEPEVVPDVRFARRAWLDIQGLLPPPEELQAFVADASPGKRSALAERLLADNDKYAEHWISFWNDLLRNDEGVNYYSETASRKSISTWLLAALKSNLSYDRFVARLLNPSQEGDPEGFLIGVNWRGVVNASQTPAMQAAQNTAQIFLGVNLKCNSCHDSFISKWKLKDAYSLAAYFSSEEKLQLYRCDTAIDQWATPSFLFPDLNREAGTDRRAAAAAIFTDPRNGRLARTVVNRIWHRLIGRGIVADPDEMDGEPWSPELLDWLSADFVDHGYDLKRLIATIVSSQAYQMIASADGPGPMPRRLTAEEFSDAIAAITGDWHVYQPSSGPGVYTREWRVAANPLTRALGRPIRDQVYGTRDATATTLQALELVNGETLTHWLMRGARKMLGQLPPEPTPLFVRQVTNRATPLPRFEVDVIGLTRLWLLVQDIGSYSPEKVEAVWSGAELVDAAGKAVPLSSLKPLDDSGLRGDGLRVKTPSKLAFDIGGRGFTTLRGSVGIENQEVTSDLNPRVRFLIFDRDPTMDRLLPAAPETPLPPVAVKTAREAVDRVFWYALGRAPSAEERAAAEKVAGAPEGLADLLWAIVMKPEFQYVY
jgi:Protein of unknown function (DUF1549)/Protein of unknown function (DUF1553)/Planctomycete cytochrome C